MSRILCLLGFLLCGCSGSQVFLDGYAGPCMPQDRDILISGGGQSILLNNLDTKADALIGGRVGAVAPIGILELGAEIDVSATTVQIEDLDVDLVPLSLLAVTRLPLFKSEDRPHGILQPYVAIGPSLLMADAELNVPYFGMIRDSQTLLTVDVRAGLAGELYRGDRLTVAPFVEYRLLQGVPEFDEYGVRMETEITAHCLLAGLSFRFGR